MKNIKDVRIKYSKYNISKIPLADFTVGLTDTIIKTRRRDLYENVFIASYKRKYWILYINSDSMTGSFNTKREAVSWFKKGGR